MVLKLNYPNAEALFNLFTTSVITRYAAKLDDQLVMLHMVAIYKKLRAKYEGVPRNSYNITVTMPEAIAYRMYWRDNFPVGVISSFDFVLGYEWSVILDHCNYIDQELINFKNLTYQRTNFLNQ